MKRSRGLVIAVALILLVIGVVAWLKVTDHPKTYNTVTVKVNPA